jgi:MOSC domain-containing protein YiiM
MNAKPSPALPGRVASLHLHPSESGAPLQSVSSIEMVEGKGIRNEPRYFGRISRRTGEPSRRQVSLIEREQIAEHAAALGLQTIAPGAVRANIETLGMNLVGLIGSEVEIGEAVLFLYEARDPCSQMDAICQGLRELMLDQRQGVMAEVRRGGTIRVGDAIRVR